MRQHLLPWAALLGVWELIAWMAPAIPSAARVLHLAWRDVADPGVAWAVVSSIGRMLVGFSLAVAVGCSLGLLIGRYRALDNILGTLVAALNAMPGAAWVPLAVFIFGLNQKAIIFTIVLGATGIVMLNTRLAIRDVPPLIIRAARTMGAKGVGMFWHVTMPAAIPRLVDGLRLAWAFGWRALMAGELLVSSVHGMGRLISEVARQRNVEQLLAYMAIIAVIGMAVDGFVFNRLIGNRIRARWGTA